MSLKVIGAGWGRTGTLSLKYALEKLGFDKCYHMMEVQLNPGHAERWIAAHEGEPVDWEDLFDGYQAAVDWPTCNFWEAQMEVFPDAKVLLSRREPEGWYKSIMNTIWPSSQANAKKDHPAAKIGSQLAYDLIWDGIFDRRMDDKDWVIAKYLEHNQRVIDTVPADKLLVYEPGQGWEPLCTFFDLPVPDEPYPRVNTTEDFKDRWRQIDEEAKRRHQ